MIGREGIGVGAHHNVGKMRVGLRRYPKAQQWNITGACSLSMGGEGAFAVKGRSAAWWANWLDLGNWFIHIYKFPYNYVKFSNKFLSFHDEFPETLKNKKKTSYFGY